MWECVCARTTAKTWQGIKFKENCTNIFIFLKDKSISAEKYAPIFELNGGQGTHRKIF